LKPQATNARRRTVAKAKAEAAGAAEIKIVITDPMLEAGTWMYEQLRDGELMPKTVVFEVFAAKASAHVPDRTEGYRLKIVRGI
jgi:hypothetical protein